MPVFKVFGIDTSGKHYLAETVTNKDQAEAEAAFLGDRWAGTDEIPTKEEKALRFAQMLVDFDTLRSQEFERKYPEEWGRMGERKQAKDIDGFEASVYVFIEEAKKVFED